MRQRKTKADGAGPAKKRRQNVPAYSESDEAPTNTSTRPPRKRCARREAVEEFENNLESSEVEEVDNTVLKKAGSPRARKKLTKRQDDTESDVATVLQEKAVKVDTSKDMLTIFTDRVTVKFLNKDGSSEQLKGHWCMICK
jgi:hypothetical protein